LCPECSRLSPRSLAPPAERPGSTGWRRSRWPAANSGSWGGEHPAGLPGAALSCLLSRPPLVRCGPRGVHLVCPFLRENPEVFQQDQRVQVPLLALRARGQALAAGTVPAFLGQVRFLRVVLGSYRDSEFASFRLEVCGVARVSGSARSLSSRSSNLPPPLTGSRTYGAGAKGSGKGSGLPLSRTARRRARGRLRSTCEQRELAAIIAQPPRSSATRATSGPSPIRARCVA